MRRFTLNPRRSAEPPRGVGSALALAAIFAGLAAITRLSALHVHQLSLFWPADGALVVAMLILPTRLALLTAALAFAANFAANLLTDYDLVHSAIYCGLNLFVSYLAAVLTRWLCGATTDLSRFRRMATFAPIALLCAAVEAAIGECVPPIHPILSDLLHDGLQWAMCDALGLILSTPAILLSFKAGRRWDPHPARMPERWALVAGAALLGVAAFAGPEDRLFLLIFPVLLLIAFRAGPSWVLASVLITALISSGLTSHGLGPFARLAGAEPLASHDLLQSFLVATFLTTVPANNALGDQARAARRLTHLKSLLEHRATHDPLTGLANRSLFRRRLQGLIASRTPCALAFVDLDRFKQVNDTLGHAAGDELLRAVAARLLQVAGEGATVARLGGDEFAVLVTGALDDLAQVQLCRRIHACVCRPVPLPQGEAQVSACIGLARPPDDARIEVSELMRRADVALYAAKSQPQGDWRLFDAELDRSWIRRGARGPLSTIGDASA